MNTHNSSTIQLLYRKLQTICTRACVCACVCVCVYTTHPDFGLPVQNGQEAVQEVCNEVWLVVGSRVKCH